MPESPREFTDRAAREAKEDVEKGRNKQMTDAPGAPAPAPAPAPQPEGPALRQSTLVGAGIGAAWGILGGPPGMLAGALVGGVVGHFWGARIVKTIKYAIEEEEAKQAKKELDKPE